MLSGIAYPGQIYYLYNTHVLHHNHYPLLLYLTLNYGVNVCRLYPNPKCAVKYVIFWFFLSVTKGIIYCEDPCAA